jgi:hypothetical protein
MFAHVSLHQTRSACHIHKKPIELNCCTTCYPGLLLLSWDLDVRRGTLRGTEEVQWRAAVAVSVDLCGGHTVLAGGETDGVFRDGQGRAATGRAECAAACALATREKGVHWRQGEQGACRPWRKHAPAAGGAACRQTAREQRACRGRRNRASLSLCRRRVRQSSAGQGPATGETRWPAEGERRWYSILGSGESGWVFF